MNIKKFARPLAGILLFFSILFLLYNCEEEVPKPRSYPQVRTNAVSDISANGARFNANIYTTGTEKIIDHGFVWAIKDPRFTASNRILLGPRESGGEFSADITTTLKKDTAYIVKAFVQTEDHFIYGLPVNFASKGSGAPAITGFEPESALWLDTVIIKGRGFSWESGLNIVRLNELQCNIVKSTDTTIKIIVNSDLNSIKSLLSVEIAGNKVIHTSDTFRLISPEFSFGPVEGIWGDTIELNGKFNQVSERNSVFFDNVRAPIIFCSSSLIKVTVPSGIANKTDVNVIYKADPFSITATEKFSLRSAWTLIPQNVSWNPGPYSNASGISFALQGSGYIHDFGSGQLYSFNPLTHIFYGLGYQSFFSYGASYAVNRDTLFLANATRGYFRFNSELNNFIRIGAYPSDLNNGIVFSLNDKIYSGLNFSSSLNRRFWMFDNMTRSWVPKSDFPGPVSWYPVSYFTISNKGYVLFTDNVFYEYNPDTDTWTRLAPFPGPGSQRFGRVSFVINGKAYIGLGREPATGGKAFSNFWIYDPVTDEWEQGERMPGPGRYNSIAFVINDKAYVGFGKLENGSNTNDFFEYDPTLE